MNFNQNKCPNYQSDITYHFPQNPSANTIENQEWNQIYSQWMYIQSKWTKMQQKMNVFCNISDKDNVELYDLFHPHLNFQNKPNRFITDDTEKRLFSFRNN